MRILASVLLLGILFNCSGCALFNWLRPTPPIVLPPPAFSQAPTMGEVIAKVNSNSQAVQELQTESATIRFDGFPSPLNAELAMRKPRKLRLRAELFQFTGRELDLGSNDELFWVWLRRDPEQAIYFARHDQFNVSRAQGLLPVEPLWLVDALGLPELDPLGSHAGPYPTAEGNYEVRSTLPSPNGEMLRVMTIDPTYGWVLRQDLYGPNGQLMASSIATGHRYYPLEQVSLPHQVRIELSPRSPTQLILHLEVSGYLINQMYQPPAELWSMPPVDGARPVDLGNPNLRLSTLPPTPSPSTASLPPDHNPRSRYRGWH